MASQLNPPVADYLEALEASTCPTLLRMEAEARQSGFPIIGAQCGRRLAILATSVGAKRVFEMGSGQGYSTIWFSRAVGPGGQVVHTDFDPENAARARENLGEAGLLDRVRFETGDSIELLSADDGTYDVILIDIDKDRYPLALETAVPKIREGGLILCHNVVWSGRVASDDQEATTVGIRRFNEAIFEHPALASYIDPIHDGLSVSLRVSPERKAEIRV